MEVPVKLTALHGVVRVKPVEQFANLRRWREAMERRAAMGW